MFVLCPHCEFLVGVDPRTGRPPATCPKCGQALEAAPAEAPTPVVDDAAAAAPAVTAPVEAMAAPAPAPEPDPAPAKLDPDAVIAAMAAKPRKSRAKPRTEAKTPPKVESPAPSRRKRTDRAAPAPADAAPDVAATPTRAVTPSLATRLSAWWSSRRKEKAVATPAPGEVPPKNEAKPKAAVRPIPSLRERAAARAAAKRATPVPEIEALSISEAPVEALPRVEPVVDATAVVEAPIVEAPVVEAPVVEAPVVEAPVVEAPVVEAPVVEAPAVVEAPVVEAPVPPAPAPPPLPPPEKRLAPRPATAPSFLRTRTGTTGTTSRWPHLATIGALTFLLALQLLLAQRDALAADARWRPTIAALCGALRCDVPAWREPDAFTMLSRDVRPHARAPGTLQIDASFRNDARWAQPWPRLVVSLSDVDGRVVGTRAFTAAEYLGAPPTQNTLASGQSAAVHLAVVEPAPGIVAFSFEFR